MKRLKTLPHSEEAERAVLGALLLEALRIAQVRTRLEARDWHLEHHRVLYQAFLDLADAVSPPDLLTLQAHPQLAGRLEAIGGLAYLAALDLDLADLGRLDEYVDIVNERSVRRDLIADAQHTALEASSTTRPVHELLADLRHSADKLLGRAARTRWEEAGAVLDRLVAALEEGRSSGIFSARSSLRLEWCAWSRPRCVTLAGSPEGISPGGRRGEAAHQRAGEAEEAARPGLHLRSGHRPGHLQRGIGRP